MNASAREPQIIDAVPERITREHASEQSAGSAHATHASEANARREATSAPVKKRATWKRALIGVLALLYVVSPLDILPDWIPLVGWLDDIGVLAWAARQVFFKKT
jgi:hypothetical protein